MNLITTKREFTVLQYSTALSSVQHHSVSYLISATWWIYRSIYIPKYSQYWFQNAVFNLNTTRRECTLLQYSTTLSSIITSFWIIFNICYMMNQQYYIHSRILLVLISNCWNEFNQYKTWIYSIIVFYNTLKHNHIILYHIWYLLLDEPKVLYTFQNTPRIVSACCIEFNHYKTWMHSITVFYNTLKHNRIILYNIWYLQHDETTVLYIYSRILPVLISKCCIELNHYKTWITLLQYSTTLSSIITSFWIIFNICYMMNQQYYIYCRILQI